MYVVLHGVNIEDRGLLRKWCVCLCVCLLVSNKNLIVNTDKLVKLEGLNIISPIEYRVVMNNIVSNKYCHDRQQDDGI